MPDWFNHLSKRVWEEKRVNIHIHNFMSDLLFRFVVGVYYYGLMNRAVWIGVAKCTPDNYQKLVYPLVQRYGFRSYHFTEGTMGDVAIRIPVELVGGNHRFWKCAPNRNLVRTPLDLNKVCAALGEQCLNANRNTIPGGAPGGAVPQVLEWLEVRE